MPIEIVRAEVGNGGGSCQGWQRRHRYGVIQMFRQNPGALAICHGQPDIAEPELGNYE